MCLFELTQSFWNRTNCTHYQNRHHFSIILPTQLFLLSIIEKCGPLNDRQLPKSKDNLK